MRVRSRVSAVVGVSLLLASALRAQSPAEEGHQVKKDVGYMAHEMALHDEYMSDCHCGCPHWFAEIGVLALDRDVIGNPGYAQVFATQGAGGPPALQFNQLHFDSEAALKVTIGHRWNERNTVEVSYFGQDTWSDQAAAGNPAGGQFSILSNYGTRQEPQFPAPPAAPTFGIGNNTTLQTIAYSSKLQSAELNLVHDEWVYDIGRTEKRPWREAMVSWIGGVRFLKLDDIFAYRTRGNVIPGVVNDPGASLDYEVRAFNRAFGPQVGVRSTAQLRRKFSIGGEAKFAVLANGEGQRTQIASVFNTPAFFGVITGSQSAIRRTFAYQLDAWAQYDLTRDLSMKLGFDFLRIAQRVLAPRQFDPNVLLNNGVLAPLNDDEGGTNFDGITFATAVRF